MARFVKFPGTAGSYASTDDINLLDCDSSWFAQGTGGLWTVGAPSTDQAWINTQSLKVLAGATTAITPATDAAFFSLYVYSAAGDTFDINGSTPVAVPAGVWTRIKEAGPDGTYTVSAVGAADYYLDGVIVQATDATFVPSLRIVGDLQMRAKIQLTNYAIGGGNTGDQYIMTLQDAGIDGCAFLVSDVGQLEAKFATSVTLGGSVLTEASIGASLTNGVTYELGLDLMVDGTLNWWKDDAIFDTDTFAANPLVNIHPLVVGAYDSGAIRLINGDVYWAEVRDGIDGPIVAEFNADDIAIP